MKFREWTESWQCNIPNSCQVTYYYVMTFRQCPCLIRLEFHWDFLKGDQRKEKVPILSLVSSESLLPGTNFTRKTTDQKGNSQTWWVMSMIGSITWQAFLWFACKELSFFVCRKGKINLKVIICSLLEYVHSVWKVPGGNLAWTSQKVYSHAAVCVCLFSLLKFQVYNVGYSVYILNYIPMAFLWFAHVF